MKTALVTLVLSMMLFVGGCQSTFDQYQNVLAAETRLTKLPKVPKDFEEDYIKFHKNRNLQNQEFDKVLKLAENRTNFTKSIWFTLLLALLI